MVISFHPGPQASVKQAENACILGILDTYQELAITPLDNPGAVETLRRRLAKQRASMASWMERNERYAQ